MVCSEILDKLVCMGRQKQQYIACIDVRSGVVYSQQRKKKSEKVIKCLGDPPPISSHLMQSSISPPLLNYVIHNNNKKVLEMEQNVLFKDHHLYCIDF